MAKKRKQFDKFLGGSESLPHEVSIMQFVSSRAREISAMTSSIENPKQTKLIFQKLPAYMRRRVMSHNVKRLPRRLREAHLAQMAKSANGQNLPSTSKRPSRKYRRRPRNLLSEYTRRQRDKIWLETHIWHAKRFHMVDKWGYRIANYSNDKCFRANYRALTENCLVQDLSYYTCVEIEGEENLLETTLKTHCNTSTVTFAAKIYAKGQREGTVMFFKKNGYPHSPIGNVNFFWKPSESNIKTIWIWIHPAFYNEFLEEIIPSFEFIRTNFNEFERDTTDIMHDSNYVYTNNAGCKMIIFKYSLNRFRLHGSKALHLLGEALQLPSLTELDSDPEMDCTITEEQESSLNNEKLDASKTSTDNSSTQPMERMAVENEENITISKDLNIQELKKKSVKCTKKGEALQLPSLTELDSNSEMDCTITKEQESSLNNKKLYASKTSTDNSSMQSIERMAVDENEENITISKDLNIQELKKKSVKCTKKGEALQLPSLTELDSNSEMDCTITKEQESSLNNKKLDASKTSTDNSSMQSIERMAVDENEENITISTDLNIQELKKKCAKCIKNWHTTYYKERENKEVFKIQEQFWQSLMFRRLNCQPGNFIIGLTVLDPRFYLPEKRTKYKTLTHTFFGEYQQPTDVNRSPIWDAKIRQIVSNSCVSTSTINKLRSECLVPGVSNDQYFDKDIIAKIPILLIGKSKSSTGLHSSIDIIIPSKWAMPFWLAFIMRCARVGALRESSLVAFESLNLQVPDINDPDCPAYMREALTTKEELINKYFRYPPNNRINYVKVGIRSPFFCDWKNLTKDWSNVEDFYILRNYRLLSDLQTKLHPVKRKNARTKSIDENIQFNLQDFDEHKNCLVHVQLTMTGKGVPKKFAIICMPTHEDLKTFESNKKWGGPREKRHTDPNEKSRKISRKKHSALLKRLRRQRVEQKETFSNYEGKLLFKESVNLIDAIEHESILRHRRIMLAQKARMAEMYLPESTEVRHSCDREVMGYVTLGAFSFLRSRGIGTGYVTLASLLEIVSKKSNIVLVRNTTTRQYRLATLDILNL